MAEVIRQLRDVLDLRVFADDFAVLFRMITGVSWIPKGAPKAMPDDAETHSKEKIDELIQNGTLKKSICYLSNMNDEDNRMEHEIHSGEVAHAKARVVSSYSCIACDDSNDVGVVRFLPIKERLAMSVERLCLGIEPESRKTMMETKDLGVSALQDLSRKSHSKLHGSVSAHRLNTFGHLYSETSLYSISGFEVTPRNNFKLSDSPLASSCVSSVDRIS
ncbi:hypothetical protein Bca101_009791 [Brassica carinata]